MAPDVDVHQQAHDGPLEIIVDPDVPLVGIPVHEIEPDVVAALPKAHMALALIGGIPGEVAGKLAERLVRGGDAGGTQKAELVVAGKALAHPEHGRNRLGVVVERPQLRRTDTFHIIQMEILVGRESQEGDMPAPVREAVSPVRVAGLGVPMLEAAAARTHVDEAVVVVGDLPHQARRRTHDPAEILPEAALLDALGRFDGKMIRVPFVLEIGGVVVAQEERAVIQAVEIVGLERVHQPLDGKESGGDLLPAAGEFETHAHRMLQVPVHVHERPGRGDEGDAALHAAGSDIPPVGIDPVGDLHPAVGGKGDDPAVHAAFLPSDRFSGGIGRGKIAQMLGEIQHLIVAGRPAGHVERNGAGTGRHRQVQVHEQVMAGRIQRDRIVHPVGSHFVIAAGDERQDAGKRDEPGK